MNDQALDAMPSADPPARILIVDDEIPHLEALCTVLNDQGYATTGSASPMEALELMRSQRFDALLTDLTMPGMDGIALMNAALEMDADLVSIMMTGYGTIPSAIKAIKTGAADYILKPFKLQEMLPVLVRSLSLRKLRLEKAELERLVRRRTHALEASNRELEAFSSSVAHDLRAPLRSILGFSRILMDDHLKELSAIGQEQLTRIRNSAQRMDEMIVSLLALARFSRCGLKRSQVDLSELALRSVAELRKAHPERTVEIVIAAGLMAECDEHLISLSFDNLLGNAWKFSAKRPDSRIEMGCGSDDGIATFFIRDNGVGFDSEKAHGLFEPFHKLHAQKDFAGTGVGLATVQRIIQRHGGDIWAKSRPQEGATFFFTLPSGQEKTRSHRRTAPPPGAGI
jgi:signal transduction histidine kinase